MKKDKEQRKQYETPVTTRTAVELESGFMADSVYKTSENTEALSIKDQQVDQSSSNFDFSSENTWEQ